MTQVICPITKCKHNMKNVQGYNLCTKDVLHLDDKGKCIHPNYNK
jgi:hypothetical protein